MLLTIEQAVERIEAALRPLTPVERSLSEAVFRVLAEPIRCDLDQPPFDRSQMDGYAVRAEDVAIAPVTLSVIEHIGAGHVPARTVGPGQAAQINTGAPLPVGADAVVRVEDTEPLKKDDTDQRDVRILKAAEAGQFITPRAAYLRAGDEVLRAGTRLGPLELAAAATAGTARLRVYPPPRAAVITTGDELVPVDQTPGCATIRNSNIHLLPALIQACHAELCRIMTVNDDPDDIGRCVDEALSDCDLLVMTGGVSMGQRDYVPDVLTGRGCTIVFHKVAIKPGRPTLFAVSRERKPVFGLPGNPVSAFIGFKLFVEVALTCLQGTRVLPRFASARLVGRLPETKDRTSFIPARLSTAEDGTWLATPLRWGGSGDAVGMVGTEAMIVRSPRQPAIGLMEIVRIMLV